MKYQELMDTCSNIWREYGKEGNSFLGLSEARRYCVRHIAECEDATQEQISLIRNWKEYKEWQAEIQQEKHKEEILNNQKENPKEYQQFLVMKKKYEMTAEEYITLIEELLSFDGFKKMYGYN